MSTTEPLPAIEPMPPLRSGPLPWIGAGLSLLRDPTELFRRSRAKLGDTFVVDAFGYRLFCVFSPEGVRRLYELAEHEASFGLATFELVMKRKVPLELLVGRRNFPQDLFGKQDVVVIHMGAQSNLYAALAWTLIDLLRNPTVLRDVLAGDDALLERCASESIRMGQRSITLRRVMTPLEYRTESGSYRLEPGVMIATMLPVNNTSCAAGLDLYDPNHYDGRRLASHVPVATRELVSTFGHGRHSCPAQRFSISAIRISIRRLLDRYEMQPCFGSVAPRRRQIGGVARAARPCRVRYRLHD